MNATETNRIVAVNFTCFFAPDGFRIRRENGAVEWASDADLSPDERDRLRAIAYHDGMTGLWYEV